MNSLRSEPPTRSTSSRRAGMSGSIAVVIVLAVAVTILGLLRMLAIAL